MAVLYGRQDITIEDISESSGVYLFPILESDEILFLKNEDGCRFKFLKERQTIYIEDENKFWRFVNLVE